MKISIITVSYNSNKTIAETVESVLSQTYSDIEYIIVDGGSIDGTVETIKKYESLFSGRLKWISEPDKGLYDAMNKGIMMANGEIVGIINSDDFYYEKDVVEKIANAFSDKRVESVFGDVKFVNPDNLDKTVRYYSSKKFTPKLFRYGFMPAHPTFFTYKKFFEEYGYYSDEYKIAADFELLTRFLYRAKISYKYLPFVFMKMRTGGLSTASFRSNILLNKEIVKACKRNGIYTNLGMLFLKYFVKIWEFVIPKQ